MRKQKIEYPVKDKIIITRTSEAGETLLYSRIECIIGVAAKCDGKSVKNE